MSEQPPTPRHGQQSPDRYQQPRQQQSDPQAAQQYGPPEPPKRSPWWTSRILIAVVSFAVGVGVGVGAMLPSRHSSTDTAARTSTTPTPSATDDEIASDDATASPSPDELMVTGSLTLMGSDSYTTSSDGTCGGAGGYSDISTGAQIAVYTGSSEQIAFGPLLQSKVTSAGCVFRFVIDEIPTGESVYNFKIGSRGGPSFHQDDLEAGDIELTLGD